MGGNGNANRLFFIQADENYKEIHRQCSQPRYKLIVQANFKEKLNRSLTVQIKKFSG